MQLIEMKLRVRLGNLHPANRRVALAEHLYLLELVAVSEAAEDALLIPSAEGNQKRLRAFEVKRQRKVVILNARGPGREAVGHARRCVGFRASAHRWRGALALR